MNIYYICAGILILGRTSHIKIFSTVLIGSMGKFNDDSAKIIIGKGAGQIFFFSG